ncbi:uncharacterized protein LOC141640646 [Silene latifolia]|uniref:uncharacterized protein LOC141640646 n=1 Tax=Silene latifolia TaxID=37657 RepID=UPI003D788DD8
MANLQVRHLFQLDGRWNEAYIKGLFTEEWATRILAIPLCEIRMRDKVYWPITKEGAYTVKSGYGLIFDDYMAKKGTIKDKTRISDRGRDFCRKTLWKLPIPKVWKILIWRIITSALPTGSEFYKRNLNIEVLCGMCGGEQKRMETPEHLFRDCGLSSRIWAGSDLGIRVESAGEIPISDWICDWIRYLSSGEEGACKVINFVAILWSLWNLRNKVIFQDLDINSQVITNFIYKSVRERVQILCNSSGTRQSQMALRIEEEGSSHEDKSAIRNGHPVSIIGKQTSCDVVRVKVDASWQRNYEAAVGWVAYDSTGKEMGRRQVRIRAESALQAEALGVRDVMLWAHERWFLHLDISSDCLQLINQIAGVDKDDHMIAGLLEDIRRHISFFHCLCFNFIPRHLNSIAQQAMRL